ncbi:putative ubiquitin-conjugating enzyme e2 23, partial [Quercus suber]
VQQLCNISKSPPDHQFFHNQFYPDENIFINKEWKTLEANLPDSIYVRAYKSRQDLMRAVIVGPKGTSYSHVFFQAQPPKLFYHSYGLDVNSNLKWNGKVLVSIRDLVFNSKPYFGRCYNKEVLMQMCKAMLFMLRDPPIDFKVFVEGYLRTNAHPILLYYKAQMGDSKATNQLFFKLQQYEQTLKEEELLEEESEGTISKIWTLECFKSSKVQQLCNISKSPPDHQFFHNQFYPDENIFINKEWKTLEANLPDSIYVRAYKSRQDLMRAVIVGPKGTSYSHVFFQAQPPKLFYHSYGLDVNSNLKWNGKVLVSIRDLVFNSKPYFGRCYNKEVLMQMCKAMLFMLRDPPIDFKVFVEGYLRTNAHPILLYYKAQMGDSKATNQLFFKLQQYEQTLKEEELLEEESEGTISKIWTLE